MIEHVEIKWKQVEQYLKAQCTAEEIAAVVGCDIRQLENECEKATGMTFSALTQRHTEAGKAMLKLWQFKAASEGDSGVIKTMTEKYIGFERQDKPGRWGGKAKK